MSQIPVDRYPFAVQTTPSHHLTPQEKEPPRSKQTGINFTTLTPTNTTNTAISTGAANTDISNGATNPVISTGGVTEDAKPVKNVPSFVRRLSRSIKDVPSHAKKQGERITSFAIGLPPPSPTRVECLLFVSNIQNVLMELENDIINVKILLASPHLGSLRTKAETAMKTLLQLKELVGLLSECQDKVD